MSKRESAQQAADRLRPMVFQALNMQDMAQHVMRECGHRVTDWTPATEDCFSLELACGGCGHAAMLELAHPVGDHRCMLLRLPSGMCGSATLFGLAPAPPAQDEDTNDALFEVPPQDRVGIGEVHAADQGGQSDG